MTDEFDAAFLRGMTQPRLSRRQLLRAGAAGAAGLGVMGFLEACGIGGTKGTGAENVDWTAFWKQQHETGTLVFANWPFYIDISNGTHPSIDAFTKKTGIKVDYKPVIQNNAPFFAKISPQLKAGQATGYDLMVITNGWELTQLINNHWLIPLDQSRMPNFYKYASPLVRNPSYDPGNKYTVTWQSGLTAIGYNTKAVAAARPSKPTITSVQDLWDPAFKGKVGMMSDDTELGALGMLAIGIDDQTKSTPADWQKAADKLKTQRDAGIVREYYDQSYIKALEDGDTWISQAWSGDIFQANESGYPDLKLVVPQEGAMFWHDNSMIPLHASNPVSAMEWINFYYQPNVEAMIEDWVWYMCPVPGAQKVIANKLNDPSVANSPLVFPTAAMRKKFRAYYDFKGVQDHSTYTSIFDPIIQS